MATRSVADSIIAELDGVAPHTPRDPPQLGAPRRPAQSLNETLTADAGVAHIRPLASIAPATLTPSPVAPYVATAIAAPATLPRGVAAQGLSPITAARLADLQPPTRWSAPAAAPATAAFHATATPALPTITMASIPQPTASPAPLAPLRALAQAFAGDPPADQATGTAPDPETPTVAPALADAAADTLPATAPPPVVPPPADEPIMAAAPVSEADLAALAGAGLQAPEGPAEPMAALDQAPILLPATAPAQAPTPVPPLERMLLADLDAPQTEGWPAIPLETRPPEPDRITLPDGRVAETFAMALREAMRRNPEILIAAAQLDDARYGVNEARAALLPQVDLSASRGRETTEQGSAESSLHTRSELSLSVRQNVWDFGSSFNGMRSAENVARSAEFAYRAQVDRIALDIADAFHRVLERQRIVELAEQNLAAHQRILETVQTQREFGLVTGADVSRVEARLNAARADILDQRSALDQSKEDFRRLLDRAPGVLAEPLDVSALLPASADDAVALLDHRNPNVMQARMVLESLERQRDQQRAGYLPRVDLELQGSMRDNAGGDNGQNEDTRAMLNVRMPLFDGGARSATIARIRARMRQAEMEVTRAQRDAEQALRNDYAALTAARDKVQAIDDEVAAAERLVSLYAEQFRNGSRSVFDLLDGQQTLYQATTKRETNRTEMRLSAYRVLSTLGALTETVVGID